MMTRSVELDCGTGGETNPIPRQGIASVAIDGWLIVGHERLGHLRILDPVAAALFGSLDGESDVGAITADVSDALELPEHQARQFVRQLLDDWHVGGLLEGSTDSLPVHRRILVPVESCLGASVGLDRAKIVQLADIQPSIRVASTLPHLLEKIASNASAEVVDDEFRECFTLRATQRKRVARLQQIFGPSGELLWLGTDPDLAVTAFHRTLAGRLAAARGGAWAEGLSLSREGRAVLVHHSVGTLAPHLPDLAAFGIEVIPAGFLQMTVPGKTIALADPYGGGDASSYDLVGLLSAGPAPVNAVERVRLALDQAWAWDETHLHVVASYEPSLEFGALKPEESRDLAAVVDGMIGS